MNFFFFSFFFFLVVMTSKTGNNSEKEPSCGAAVLPYPFLFPPPFLLLFPSD